MPEHGAALRIAQARVSPGDPHVNTDGRDQLSLRYAVYDTLVCRDDAGRFVPALSRAWSCEPDARTWTVQLREDVSFSDGRRLTADDVVASIERVGDPESPGEMATQGVLSNYLGDALLEATGPHNLRIVTQRPLADLLDLLVDIAIIPAATARANLAGPETPGTGPYRIIAHGDSWAAMEAIRGHWNGEAPYPSIRWQAEPDALARAMLVADGSVELATDIGVEGQRVVEGATGTSTTGADISTCVAVLLNCATGPCVDLRVRQALNYGANVDRFMRDALGGATRRVNGPLSALHAGYDPGIPAYPHDTGRARDVLREAGHADGLELTLDVPERLPDESRALAESLASDYAEIGVRLQTRLSGDRPAYAAMVRARQIADGCFFDSSPLSTYRVLREKLHSGERGLWWQGYANPAVDRLIDTAAATVNDADRRAIYRDVSRIVRDDAPWLFLYTPRVIFGMGPRLRQWRPALNGIVRFA